MTPPLDIARQQLLAPAGLAERDLERILGQLLAPTVDYADIYMESTRAESWTLEDGIVRSGSYRISQGAGLRAVSGEKTGFAYTDEILLPALSHSAQAARAIASHGQQGSLQAWRRGQPLSLYRPEDPLLSLDDSAKVSLLQELDGYVRGRDPRISQVMINLSGELSTVLIAASDGTLNADIRPLIRLNISVIVEQGGRRESGGSGGGGRRDYRWLDSERLHGLADQAIEQALTRLEAGPAPAGGMTVVLGPGWPGILLHEAIGHGLEGDFNRKGTSAFSGRIGERVAAPGCTVVDDATLASRRGSLNMDDEGTPGQNTVLIEDGILRAYMQDKHNAFLMGQTSTGNARRQSYAHRPMPRMTNTCMLPGPFPPEEIIASVRQGLYARNFGGGQVDITNGKFVFTTSEAWLIEHGRITRPVKGATLIGNGPEVLTKVSMIGNDMALDQGVGTCGKEGQSVPVGVGQPTLKIDELTVGGTDS